MFSKASGSWWITTTSFKGYWVEGKKNTFKKQQQKLTNTTTKTTKPTTSHTPFVLPTEYKETLEIIIYHFRYFIAEVSLLFPSYTQFPQAYPTVSKLLYIPKVLIRDTKNSNLDWNSFSVSDYSSKLNNRLQTRNGTFNFFVDEILPRLKRKHYIASFSWYLFEQIENILLPSLKFAAGDSIRPCLEQYEKWTNVVFFSHCGDDDEEITHWRQKSELFLNHLLWGPLIRWRWWIQSYYLFY